MKAIRFTRHARNRIRWRRVAREGVEKVLRQPERVEPTRFGRLNAYARIEGRLLKVTYADEADAMVVISVVAKK